jgi:ubiquitin-activating enzyme E1 C
VKGVSITPHNCKIQDKDDDFYNQFGMVICGLDSIEARRWINTQLVEMAQASMGEDGQDAEFKPLIDGGTEGLSISLSSRRAC